MKTGGGASPSARPSIVKIETLSVLTFNCCRLKSSVNYVTYMMTSLDIAVLCEHRHWLIEREIMRMRDEVSQPHMESSMTSEDLTTAEGTRGRVGFVCKQQKAGRNQVRFRPCDRPECQLQWLQSFTRVWCVHALQQLTASQTQIYIDTLTTECDD